MCLCVCVCLVSNLRSRNLGIDMDNLKYYMCYMDEEGMNTIYIFKLFNVHILSNI